MKYEQGKRSVEQGLLRDIGRLSDELLELRRKDASGNKGRVAAVEVALREKWQELRRLRAATAWQHSGRTKEKSTASAMRRSKWSWGTSWSSESW
jgi:hypothetical protein